MDSKNGISMRCDQVKIGTPREIEAAQRLKLLILHLSSDSITGNRIDQEPDRSGAAFGSTSGSSFERRASSSLGADKTFERRPDVLIRRIIQTCPIFHKNNRVTN
jgi:hypothetical protein